VLSDVLELLDLTHKRDDFVNGLSRGMKQRLCLAKTLVHDPPVLILDEPSSGLDPRARMEVKALLKELRRMGKTILISSHILTELADCCTSIGIIERGQLLLHGPIEKVYRQIQRNRTLEVRFSGEMAAGVSLIRSDPKVRQVIEDTRSCTVELDGGRRRRPAIAPATRRGRLRTGLVRRQGADAGRRVHAGHQGAGDVAGRCVAHAI
jgi:ABC-2 type transport system ATP-binding protein